MRPSHAKSKTPRRAVALLPLVCTLLAGCGGTTVGIVAGLSGSSGGGSSTGSPATLTDVIIEARTSPATVRFTLTDAESNTIDVALTYEDPVTGSPIDLVLVAGPEDEISTNLRGLASSPQGVVHEKRWDFSRDDQLGTASLTPRVLLSFRGKEGASDLEARRLRIDIGNDPPSLVITSAPGRSVTILARTDFVASDSSNDLVTVSALFDLLDDDPDAGPIPATGGTVAGPGGQPVAFLWDAQTDLGFSDHDVELTFLSSDGVAPGAPALDLVRVDNNTEPRIEINDAALLLSSDRRGGIPVPFTLFDGNLETGEPGDEAAIVFQWRTSQQSAFPGLPPLRNAGEARALLRDPELAELRRQLQICTEIPRTFQGRLLPAGALSVRLPELATTAAGALERDPLTRELRVTGTLEILRASSIPIPVRKDWSQDPGLTAPVAALPVGNGPLALVLEDLGGSWRLRSLNAASGENARILAQGANTPTALAYEPGETSVVIGLFQEVSSSWELRRVDLAGTNGGQGQLLATSFDGRTEGGRIRGLACAGTGTALVTARRSLIKVTYPTGNPPVVATLFGPPETPLDAPWGIAIDPLVPHRVYIAENGRNRILTVRTDRLETVEVRASGIGVPRPTALAIEKRGVRLLVVTDEDPDDGTRELRSLELGSAVDLDGDGRADLDVHEIGRGYDTTGIATGPDGYRILPLRDASDLAVGGGVTHRAVLEKGGVTYAPASQTVHLDEPLSPVPQGAAPWRLARTVPAIGTPGGTNGVFVWSSDDASQGSVRLGAVAFDNDRGLSSRPSAQITVRSTLDAPPAILATGRTGGGSTLISADLDRDGDLDLALTEGGADPALVLLFQTSPGRFDGSPTVLAHPALATPTSLAAADLDQDGDLDLVSTTLEGQLVLFFQTSSPGVFDPEPAVLENAVLEFPGSVVAADLDSDGDLDLAVLSTSTADIVVFFQTSPGVFDDEDPLVVEVDTTLLIQRLLAADLDQDGDLDLAATATSMQGSSPLVTILFQTAPGVFDTTSRLELRPPPAVMQLLDLIAADLDRDGDLDLVAAGFDPPAENRTSLSLFFQSAPGTFDPEPTVLIDPDFAINRLTSVAAADVDGDGDVDLVATDDIATKLVVYLQTTRGAFDPLPISIDVPGIPSRLVAADLDADGSIDLAMILGNQELALVFQITPGDFEAEPSLLANVDFVAPVSVATTDLDQDGDLDLVSANQASGNLAIFAQTSPGVFDVAVVLEDPSLDGVVSVAAADLDQDGDVDLASASSIGGNIDLLFQTSPGVFGDPILLSGGFLSFVRTVRTADIDGDGDLDLVASARNRIGNTPNLSVFFQSSPGTFDLEDRIVIRTAGNATQIPTAADLDGDGDMDLVAANPVVGNDNLTLLFQTSPRVFGDVRTLTADSLKFAQAVVTADMDGDGDLDLVVLARIPIENQPTLTVLFQSSPGVFDLENPRVIRIPGNLGQAAVAVADLDGDGDLDLVTPAFGPSGASIALFLQTTPGDFDPVPTLLETASNSISSLTVADLDQDGDLDIVASDSQANLLAVFFGAN